MDFYNLPLDRIFDVTEFVINESIENEFIEKEKSQLMKLKLIDFIIDHNDFRKTVKSNSDKNINFDITAFLKKHKNSKYLNFLKAKKKSQRKSYKDKN